jgi:magnesium transporter
MAPASRPTPLSRVWAGDKIVAEDLTGEDLSDVLELNSRASAWWVLPRNDHYASAEMRDVAQALDLDQLALKDLFSDDHRAKLEVVGQARLVMTNAVVLDPETITLQVHPVSIVVTDRALICLLEPSPDFQLAGLLAQQEQALAEGGVELGLQLVLGAVIRTYEVAVEFLENASDDLADILFEERPLNRSEQLRAFRLRTALSQLRRRTEPMRTVMGDLVANPARGKGQKDTSIDGTTLSRRWVMLAEQHTRVANAADALREALSSVFDTSLALADLHGNQIMKSLTGWAAIIAVPTLVTGFVGMNVSFPLDGTTAGFWVYLVLMVLASLILFSIFKRKDWI